MIDLIEDLKHRARRLHASAQIHDPEALAGLRLLPELRALDDAALAAAALRRHALAAIAVALGFRGWSHAVTVLSGAPSDDRGSLLHRDAGGAYWNIWCAHYEEARTIRAEHGGYLLAYRRQFLVVDEHYLRALGIDPDDADWDRIGRDWVEPTDRAAWGRLTAKVVAARLERPWATSLREHAPPPGVRAPVASADAP